MLKEKVKVLVEIEMNLYSSDYDECDGIEDAVQQYFDDEIERNNDFQLAKVKKCEIVQSTVQRE